MLDLHDIKTTSSRAWKAIDAIDDLVFDLVRFFFGSGYDGGFNAIREGCLTKNGIVVECEVPIQDMIEHAFGELEILDGIHQMILIVTKVKIEANGSCVFIEWLCV